MKHYKVKPHCILFLIAALSFALDFVKLHDPGFGNSYYAAAVKSMLTSWHNFFFVSYDPGGFISVDKPPLALWIQSASAALFGFHNWALLLPQAVASVLSVLILYKIVRNAYGVTAGLVSSFILATTPIFVAVSRLNEPDPVLVTIILCAAWAINIAAGKGRVGWLLLSMALVGLGFNTKMAEAYMAIPAFYSVYFFSSPCTTGRKLIDLGTATIMLLAVSLSWALIVDLTPPQNRPYVGSSQNNSELNLAIGYNGINRLSLSRHGNRRFWENQSNMQQDRNQSSLSGEDLKLSDTVPRSYLPDGTARPGAPGFGMRGRIRGGGGEGGRPGVLRLFNQQMAGQISWLLPLALLGFTAALIRGKKEGLNVKSINMQSIVFWSAWILPMMIYFSITGFFHRYYMCMLAPGIAALCGIGLKAFWEEYGGKGLTGWMLPLSLTATAIVQVFLLSRYPGWRTWTIPAVLGLCLVSSVILMTRKTSAESRTLFITRASAIIGAAALFISPFLWSITPLVYGDQTMPFAGPELMDRNHNGMAGWNGTGYPANDSVRVTRLVQFLVGHRNGEKFLAGVPNVAIASPIILKTGRPVMAMGGFMGNENPLTVEQLKGMVDQGEVRYVLIGKPEDMRPPTQRANGFGPMFNQGRLKELYGWVLDNGKPVDRKLWMDEESNPPPVDTAYRFGRMAIRNLQLYDCRP